MTVVGTRGQGRVVGLLLGSVSGALVRHAKTPVVVVRPVPSPRRGVLIAADGSEESLGLVEHAARERLLRDPGSRFARLLAAGQDALSEVLA